MLDPFSPQNELYSEFSRMNSELANLQRQLAQHNAELRAVQACLTVAVDLARLATWEYDPATDLLTFDDHFYSLYGTSAGQEGGYQVPLEVYIQKFIHPDQAAAVREGINRALASPEPEYSYQVERRIRIGTGEERFFSVQARVSRDSQGRVVKIFGANQDITERKQAEQQVRELYETLEQRVAERTDQLKTANKEMESISYSIAHDLTTPLRAVNGYSHLLLDEFADLLGERGRTYLHKIVQASLYMAEVNDGLRLLLKVTRTELKPTRVDLGSLARSAIDDLCQQQPERQVEFTCQQGLVVQADPHLIQVALEHLLENAWKFSRNSPSPVRIEFGCLEQASGRVFFVKDNGIGFDMAFASKLFGNFERLNALEDYGGTGIGLAVVRRIIQRHGGSIWAEGAPNQGATFYFTLG